MKYPEKLITCGTIRLTFSRVNCINFFSSGIKFILLKNLGQYGCFLKGFYSTLSGLQAGHSVHPGARLGHRVKNFAYNWFWNVHTYIVHVCIRAGAFCSWIMRIFYQRNFFISIQLPYKNESKWGVWIRWISCFNCSLLG